MTMIDPLPAEHRVECKVPHCRWAQSWTTHPAAQSAALWHLFADHADLWDEGMREFGAAPGKPPLTPRPETLGEIIPELQA